MGKLELKKIREEKKHSEKSLKKLQQEHKNVDTLRAQLETMNEQLVGKIRELSRDFDQQQLPSMSEGEESSHTRESQLDEDIASVREQLEKELRDRDEHIEELNRMVTTMTEVAETMKVKIEAEEEKNQQLTQECQQAVVSMAEAEEWASKCMSDHSKLKDEYDQIVIRNVELEAKLDMAREREEEMKSSTTWSSTMELEESRRLVMEENNRLRDENEALALKVEQQQQQQQQQHVVDDDVDAVDSVVV